MVSWKQKAPVVRSAFDKFDMEPLKEPVTVRLRFRKTGDLQYISHLDLQRVMSRVLIRSGVPIWFTQGFNPHPKMVFGMPLSVGAQSECEYLDVKIDRKISLTEIVERLNAEVTREMHFKAAYYPSSKLSDIALVKYVIEISEPKIDKVLAEVQHGKHPYRHHHLLWQPRCHQLARYRHLDAPPWLRILSCGQPPWMECRPPHRQRNTRQPLSQCPPQQP